MNIKYTYNTIHIYTCTGHVLLTFPFIELRLSRPHRLLPPSPYTHAHLGTLRDLWVCGEPRLRSFGTAPIPFCITVHLLLLHSDISSENPEKGCGDQPLPFKNTLNSFNASENTKGCNETPITHAVLEPREDSECYTQIKSCSPKMMLMKA